MRTLIFQEEHITPKVLATKLKKSLPEIIHELETNKERGLVDEQIKETTILGWSTVSRICKAHNFDAEDIFVASPTINLNPQEKEVLKKAAAFHRAYQESLKTHLREKEAEGLTELCSEHEAFATAIETVLKKSEPRRRIAEPTIEL